MKKKYFKILSLIDNDNSYHKTGSKKYKLLKDNLKNYIKKFSKKGDIYQPLKNIKVKLPYYEMGKINSLNLFELDEFIIFSIYSKIIKKNSRVADLGANIGLHTIIMSKLGGKVSAYEPDIDHANQLSKNLKINKTKAQLVRKAVFTKKTNIKFTKVIDNSTSSFIGNAKKPYGPIKTIKVKTVRFLDILETNDILKIDVEGVEDKLIESTKEKNWNNKFAILEVGTAQNAKKVFSHLKKFKSIKLLSQKQTWKKVEKLSQMPKSYKDGSLIICNKDFFYK
ncbi:FkbM family methyltransferase [Candidatus Pelagibacter ubique]|jgi:FkbM family methyltransferase|nr:FkbM family methyltransferase [Candidatus Pelagibacter ubique]